MLCADGGDPSLLVLGDCHPWRGELHGQEQCCRLASGVDGGHHGVPGTEYPPTSAHIRLSLSHRAEVILGNILKKKGWRYCTAGHGPCHPQRDPLESFWFSNTMCAR